MRKVIVSNLTTLDGYSDSLTDFMKRLRRQ
jgi:hypothetical protein